MTVSVAVSVYMMVVIVFFVRMVVVFSYRSRLLEWIGKQCDLERESMKWRYEATGDERVWTPRYVFDLFRPMEEVGPWSMMWPLWRHPREWFSVRPEYEGRELP